LSLEKLSYGAESDRTHQYVASVSIGKLLSCCHGIGRLSLAQVAPRIRIQVEHGTATNVLLENSSWISQRSVHESIEPEVITDGKSGEPAAEPRCKAPATRALVALAVSMQSRS
jgi:hypothetical protein